MGTAIAVKKRSGQRGPKGVRLNPAQDERTRSAIQTTQILKRLQAYIFLETELGFDPLRTNPPLTDDEKAKLYAYRRAFMTPNQVNAAALVLRKSLPDLVSIEPQDQTLNVNHTIVISTLKEKIESQLARLAKQGQLIEHDGQLDGGGTGTA